MIKKDWRTRGFEIISDNQWAKDINVSPEYLIMPYRKTKYSSGYDFHSLYNFTLIPNQEINLPTGIKVHMLPDEELLIFPRSGLGFKYYTRLANTIGKIDSDYYNNIDNDGHIWIKIRNEGNKILNIKQGDAIAQGTFYKYLITDGDSFSYGIDRFGGFGSSDE